MSTHTHACPQGDTHIPRDIHAHCKSHIHTSIHMQTTMCMHTTMHTHWHGIHTYTHTGVHYVNMAIQAATWGGAATNTITPVHTHTSLHTHLTTHSLTHEQGHAYMSTIHADRENQAGRRGCIHTFTYACIHTSTAQTQPFLHTRIHAGRQANQPAAFAPTYILAQGVADHTGWQTGGSTGRPTGRQAESAAGTRTDTHRYTWAAKRTPAVRGTHCFAPRLMHTQTCRQAASGTHPAMQADTGNGQVHTGIARPAVSRTHRRMGNQPGRHLANQAYCSIHTGNHQHSQAYTHTGWSVGRLAPLASGPTHTCKHIHACTNIAFHTCSQAGTHDCQCTYLHSYIMYVIHT